MLRVRCFVGLVVAFACGAMVLPTLAQDKQEQKKKKGGGGGFGGAGGFGRGAQGPLVSDALQEKLNLTAEQKSSITKLNGEFKDKSQPINDKLAELRKGGFNQDSIKDMREQNKALQELRGDYQKKVTALLNDDQKKTYEEAIQNRGFGGGFGGFGGFGGGGTPGQILSPALQDRLKLTQEQKDKLAKIQKDVDAKLADVLTPEQKKQLEELKTPRKGPANPKGAGILEAGGGLQKLQEILPQLQNLQGADIEQIRELLQQLKKRRSN
jgi:protein CpxP